MTITAPIVISTIGEIICPGEPLQQTSEGASVVNFRIGPDVLAPGGAGVYRNGIEGRKIIGNAAEGLSVGGDDPIHEGDYFVGRDLFFTGCTTAIHFHSMAMGWLQNVLVNYGDVGFRVTGGSSNSHFWQGVTCGNVQVGVSWETPGCGNVIMPGDMGMLTTAFDFAAGFHGSIVGGNNEATITGKVFVVRADASLGTFGVGGHGLRTTPAFDVTNGTGKLIHINTSIGHQSGVMLVTGAGYGTTLGLEPGFNADTQFNDAGRKWKELPFSSVFRTALESRCPADADHYGAVAHVIRDETGHGGLVRVSVDAGGNHFHDWLCKEDNPAV